MATAPSGEPRIRGDWTFAEVIATRRRPGLHDVPSTLRIPLNQRVRVSRAVIQRLCEEYNYAFTVLREFR